jgi:hypothetical protein
MTRTLPQTPIDFENPAAVRKFARIISLAIFLGAAAFAVVINMLPAGPTPVEAPQEHKLYTPFVIIAAALVLVATSIGSRMHTFQGPLAARCRRTLTLHIITLAFCEAAAFLGLVLVTITHSWDVVLPAAIGFAGLVTTIIRGEFRFSRLVEEAAGQE